MAKKGIGKVELKTSYRVWKLRKNTSEIYTARN